VVQSNAYTSIKHVHNGQKKATILAIAGDNVNYRRENVMLYCGDCGTTSDVVIRIRGNEKEIILNSSSGVAPIDKIRAILDAITQGDCPKCAKLDLGG
jgi:hypothetical protein